MKDVTIVVQGKIEQEAYDFYVENYKEVPVIISTWIGTKINFNKAPKNFTIILDSLPIESGPQNMNYQFVSTLNGLNLVKTKYAIKIRGDEYYSNWDYVLGKIIEFPNKIWSSPMFFRWWNYIQYHISDHIIAGTTENLKLMFEWTKFNYDNVTFTKINDDDKAVPFWEPEIIITKSYLKGKEPNRFHTVDGRILMSEHFDILDLNEMKPFFMKANIFKTYWKDVFIPEKNYSISSIKKLFASTQEEAYKIE
jgi:hypothetical protein